MSEHKMLPDGESTERWAIHGFMGKIEQFLNCARCGERLPGYNEPRHFGRSAPVHCVCDDCYEALP